MKLSQITNEQIHSWVEDVDREYAGRYTAQYKKYFEGLKPEDDCEPYLALKNIKEADPNYRENIRKILATRKNIFGSGCRE